MCFYCGISAYFPGSICRSALAHPFCSAFFTKKALPKVILRERQCFVYSLFLKSCLKSIKLMAKLTRQLVAELLVVLFNFGSFLLPNGLVNL